jgi:hypothetical protein
MHHAYGIQVFIHIHFPMVETIGYNIKSCLKAFVILAPNIGAKATAPCK